MKNQRGVSIIEVVIAMGIFTAVAVTGAVVASNFAKDFRKIEKYIDSEVEKDLATQFLFRDLQSAQLGFNYLTQPDDNQKNFFDYLPSRSGNSNQDESRTLTIKAGTNSTSFFLIVPDAKKSIPYPYFPIKAYDIPPPAHNMNDTPAVTFVSVNKQNAVSNIDSEMWQDGNWILLHTPVWFNEPTTGIPRQLRFLGTVNRDSLNRNNMPSRYQQDPRNPSSSIQSADQFFRRLPAVGGGAPVVFIQKINIISYEIVEEVLQGKTYRSLYRLNWKNDMQRSSADKIMVTKDIEALKLTRSSVHKKTISVEVIK